jgi:hypothetical protein
MDDYNRAGGDGCFFFFLPAIVFIVMYLIYLNERN